MTFPDGRVAVVSKLEVAEVALKGVVTDMYRRICLRMMSHPFSCQHAYDSALKVKPLEVQVRVKPVEVEVTRIAAYAQTLIPRQHTFLKKQLDTLFENKIETTSS